MSVDADGGKLKSFQSQRPSKKVNKQVHQKNFKKCRDDSLVKKIMGTRVGMEHVQE